MTDAMRLRPEAPTISPAVSPAGVPEFRFSTEHFSERNRMDAWRDIFGRTIVNVDFELLDDGPVDVNAVVRSLPSLGVVTSTVTNLGYLAKRTSERRSNCGDDIILTVIEQGSFRAQFGHDVMVGGGEAIAQASSELGTGTVPSKTTYSVLRIPRPALAPLVRDVAKACGRRIQGNCEPLLLLRHHLIALQRPSTLWSQELQRVYVTHTQDLVALVLGATGDAGELAKDRGLQAARLRAIKDDIVANLHRPELSVNAVAKRQRVTARHVQKLFEMVGTTFSQFVREQRLARVRRMLESPRCSGLSITAIAYEAGFGDLYHFNHAFRRAYGMTPSDVRAGAANTPDA